MGMCAELIAIGPFSKEIAGHLGYSRDFYARAEEGAIVTHRLFGIMEGSTLSRRFAALLGIGDPWDFNQHHVEPRAIDVAGLQAFAREYPDYERDVGSLLALLAAGFDFHFRPEG